MTIILKAANSNSTVKFAGSRRASDFLRRHGANLEAESNTEMTFLVESPSVVYSKLLHAGII